MKERRVRCSRGENLVDQMQRKGIRLVTNS